MMLEERSGRAIAASPNTTAMAECTVPAVPSPLGCGAGGSVLGRAVGCRVSVGAGDSEAEGAALVASAGGAGVVAGVVAAVAEPLGTATDAPGAALLRAGRPPAGRLPVLLDRLAEGVFFRPGAVTDGGCAGSGSGSSCCGSSGPPTRLTATSAV